MVDFYGSSSTAYLCELSYAFSAGQLSSIATVVLHTVLKVSAAIIASRA